MCFRVLTKVSTKWRCDLYNRQLDFQVTKYNASHQQALGILTTLNSCPAHSFVPASVDIFVSATPLTT
jgi:hypothetical protein